MKRVGISINASSLTAERLNEFSEAGIDCFEVIISCPEECKGIKELSAKCKVSTWTVHLPFDRHIDISSLEPGVAENTVKLHTEIMKAAAKEGIGIFVIHPSSEPIADEERRQIMEKSMSNLRILAEEAAKLGCVIAVEDLPRTCLGRNSQELLELVSADDRLRICFDTNHLLSEPIEEFIRNCGSKIITVHFSDYDFIDERHLMPGEGDIDWVSLINELENTGYEGPILYELGFGSTRHIQRPKDLCAVDFKNNYISLINREKPTTNGGILLYKKQN